MSDHTTGGTDESRTRIAAHPSPRVHLLVDSMKATAWQAHSVRGFLSGTVRKKMGRTVTSTKGEHGERSYYVKS